MEREIQPIGQSQGKPFELTGEGKTAYSNGMSEIGGEIPQQPSEVITPNRNAGSELSQRQVARQIFRDLSKPEPLDEPGISRDERQERIDHGRSYWQTIPDTAKRAGLTAKWRSSEGEVEVDSVKFSGTDEHGNVHLELKIGDETKVVTPDQIYYPDNDDAEESAETTPDSSDSASSEPTEEPEEAERESSGGSGEPPEDPPAPPSGAPEKDDGSSDGTPSEEPAVSFDETRKFLDDKGIKYTEKKHKEKDALTPDEAAERLRSGGRKKEASGSEETARPSSERRRSREDESFKVEILTLMSDPKVREVLKSKNPNLYQIGISKDSPEYSDKLEKLVSIFEKINPIDSNLVTLADIISREELTVPDIIGGDNIILSDETRKLLYEWCLEALISTPDTSPTARYSIGGFTAQNNLDSIIGIGRSNFDYDKEGFEHFAEKIANTIEARMQFHELGRRLSQKEEYLGFIIEELKAHGLHFVYNEMAGAHQVFTQLERSYFHGASLRNRWLSQKDVDEIEGEAEQRINDMWKAGKLRDGERILTKWEKDRAVRLAKIFYSGIQRRALAVGSGDLSPDNSDRVGSKPDEFRLRTLLAVKSIGGRFHGLGPAQKDMIPRILNRFREQEKGDEVKTKSLLGASEESMMFNQWGAPDLMSHGWRSQLLYMSAIRIGDRTLLDVFNELTAKHHLVVDEKSGRVDPVHGYKGKLNKTAFNSEITDFILGQTLYLTPLTRQDFSLDIKTRIWQKKAVLDPLAIVTLRPEIIKSLKLKPEQVELWKSIIPHLDIAHAERMNNELIRYRSEKGLDISDIEAEAAKYKNGVAGEAKYEIVNTGYLSDVLDTDQKTLLRTVIDASYDQAEYLATAKFPHTYMLDDAPFVAWADAGDGSGMGDENMFRGFGDQKTLQEAGWSHINNLFQHPKLGVNGEVFDKAFLEAFAMVHSPDDARKILEPFILGWLDFASMSEKSKWLGFLEKERQKPRSPIEKYYPKTFIALDEESKAAWLDARAEVGSVPNTIEELNKFKRKAKANRARLLLKTFREWLQLLPASFVEQFAKMMGIEIKAGVSEGA